MLDGLFARIEDQREALVELTRELVQFPTVNPPGEAYKPCARHLGNRLSHAGFDVSYVRAKGAIGDSERYPRINVIARYQGRGPGPCVHFNGHIDVVEPGHGWTINPFAGIVQGGRLYGRGTCDMKGGIAAAVVALESVLAAGIKFDGALEVSGTVDEESGGYAGVAYLAGQGRFSRPQVDHVIIPEPSPSTGSALATAACGGRRSRRSAGSRTARCRFSASVRSGTWAHSSTASSGTSCPGSRPGRPRCRWCRARRASRP
jgi:succinyl-diaminopimelate desuccinylase